MKRQPQQKHSQRIPVPQLPPINIPATVPAPYRADAPPARGTFAAATAAPHMFPAACDAHDCDKKVPMAQDPCAAALLG
jgi:hypothetical protein